jgi:polyisoprenyl-phosphate glycosyltransferase
MFNVPDISIVVPVYGSDGTLEPLYQRVASTMEKIQASFELIFIDDCGPGNSWQIINRMAQNDPRVTGIKLSKNFGQHRAIMAGIDVACGNWLVIMDCDLQDRPEEIARLWAKAQEGNDVVIGRRVKRQDGFFKRLSSRLFHWFFGFITNQQSDAAQSNFGIYSRKVVDAVRTLLEYPGIFPFLVRRAGFGVVTIEIEHGRRTDGRSSYTFGRKLSLAMDIIVYYSNKPLKLIIHFWFVMVLTIFCCGIWFFTRYFLPDYMSAGWISLMIPLFFLSVLLFFVAGIWGAYIGRVSNQVKKRPLYVVTDRTQVT